MFSSILLLLILLSGCNKRNTVEIEETLDGTYELVYFISSRLNSNQTPYDPFSVFESYTITILENELTLSNRLKTSGEISTQKYTIASVHDNYLTIVDETDLVMQDKFYFDLKSGTIELVSIGGENRHYIFSKHPNIESKTLPNGKYALVSGYGYRPGEIISPSLYEYFEFTVSGKNISYTSKRKDGDVIYGSGTYVFGITAVETLMENTKEYLQYDPTEKTLTYKYEYSSFNADLRANFYLVFKFDA